MKGIFKWFVGFLSLSAVTIILAGAFVVFQENKSNSDIISVSAERDITVVLDPGHGGEDGGGVAADGTLEKELNLSVSKKIFDILTLSGVSCSMTRDSDMMLYDAYGDLEDYTGVKKTYDLKNRVQLAAESECELFVSIHMNKFADSSYRGLQVYYSNNDSNSITAALRIQSAVKEILQDENDREVKRAGSNIYILHRAKVPAVLVECGFISNEEELYNLKNDEYQKALALCISAGIIESLKEFQT